jgi:hypothetical protein
MGLRIFTPPTSTLYQISNSLKTENSLTVLPRLLSVFRTERRRSSAKKTVCQSPRHLAAKSVNVSMLKAGHNTVSPRLSLLFPKLRLSNFMISSLASAVFVQCPPQCAQLSRQTLPASLPPHRASCWQQPAQAPPRRSLWRNNACPPVTRPAKAKVYDYSQAYKALEQAHRPPAMSLKQINYYLSIIISFSSLHL